MAQYAQGTDVTPLRSRQEIEQTLTKYGCDAFGYLWDSSRHTALITFRMEGMVFRLSVYIPDVADKKDVEAARKAHRSTKPEDVVKQAEMQRWRAMALYVKALCEAIENRVLTPDQAFMPWVVLPNGQTMSEYAGPQLKVLIAEGRMPARLPGS